MDPSKNSIDTPEFTPSLIELFMGGDFQLGRPRNVGELRRTLQAFQDELAGWGDETEISEVHAAKGEIQVTLTKGIPA